MMTRGISAAKSARDLTRRRRDAEGMKPSGIPWIGDIPEGWEVGHLKNCFAKTFTGVWGDESGKNENTIVCYRIADFNFSKGIVSDEKLTKRSYHHSELDGKIVKKGDLLLEKSGGGDLNPVGRAVIVKYDMMATCSNFIQDLRCNEKHDELYVEYVLRALYFKGVNGLYYNQTIGIQNLQVGKYLSAAVAIPPLAEQKAIAAYLDEKCAAIDAAVAEAKTGIEEYKAWKKSLIFEAVTGKMNSDYSDASLTFGKDQKRRSVSAASDKSELKNGDENWTSQRKMKPSGIPWIGDIPEGWETRRLKGIISRPLQYGASESGVAYKETLPRYIRITDISLDGKLKNEGALSLSEETARDYILQDHDILLARSGATVGKAFFYDIRMGRAAFAGYLIRATIDRTKALPRFVHYTMLGSGYDGWRSSIAVSATIQNIGADKYNNYSLPVPPLAEQKAIAAYLDEKCAAIDALVAEKEALIADLEAYKKSLIFEVVTGKLEVA